MANGFVMIVRFQYTLENVVPGQRRESCASRRGKAIFRLCDTAYPRVFTSHSCPVTKPTLPDPRKNPFEPQPTAFGTNTGIKQTP
jgi:hypothetical protein